MKKFISCLLAVIIIVTSMSLGDLKADTNKYVLKDENKITVKEAVSAEDLLEYMNNASKFTDLNKQYTLTLNDNLEIPTDRGRLKTLVLNGNITIEGKGYTISGAPGGKEGDRLIKVAEKVKVTINNLKFNGLSEGIKKYGGVDAEHESDSDFSIYMGLSINNCEFHSCKADRGAAVSFSAFNLDFNLTNTTIESCEAKQSAALYIECAKSSENEPNPSICDIDKLEVRNCLTKNDDTTFGTVYLERFKEAKVRNSIFENNKVEGNSYYIYGAGIQTKLCKLEIENCKFLKNEVNATSTTREVGGTAIFFSGGQNTIKHSVMNENVAHSGIGGALCFLYDVEDVVGNVNASYLTIEDSEIIKNQANYGGGILTTGPKLTIKNSKISENIASGKEKPDDTLVGYGGAIYFLKDGNYPYLNLDLDGVEISNNIAELYGGGISILFDRIEDRGQYDSFAKEIANANNTLKIHDNVIFKNNKAKLGYYNPPNDIEKYKNYQHKNNSLKGKIIIKKDNKFEFIETLMNNYDIDNLGSASVYYVPNGASGAIFEDKHEDNLVFINDYITDNKVVEAKVKTIKEVGFSSPSRFIGWNTEADASGEWYSQGAKLENHRSNLTLFAIWEKPNITLTLDENYKGGKITDNEVMVGDTMDPYLYKPKRRGFTFKGWSYNKKHLDKVHYDDRIYEDTTVYAIWDEVEEEPEEIKGQEHKAYIFGYPDGTVRPNGEITRAEAAAMLARLLEIESIGSAEAPNFPDTPSAWYNKAINAVVARGIMKGYPDGTFKPNSPITRAEFTQMISTIDNKPYGTAPFADVVGHWAERPIGSEYQAGRIMGYPDGTFRPDNSITRCEAAVILNKIFERNFDAMSLMKCKNPMMIKYFTDLDASFWGYNDMVEATNTHEYVRRSLNRVPEDWLLIK